MFRLFLVSLQDRVTNILSGPLAWAHVSFCFLFVLEVGYSGHLIGGQQWNITRGMKKTVVTKERRQVLWGK